MAGTTFGKIKTWVAEILTPGDLNAEFDNLYDNLDLAGIGDASANDAAFQTQTDPFPGSVITKPTSGAGELHVSRFEIADIKGTTFHYQDANSNLNKLFAGEVATAEKSDTYTVTTSDGIIYANLATSKTFTLPAVSGNDGKVYWFSKIDATTSILTIDGNGSETVGGSASRFLRSQYDYLVLVCDETNSDWVMVSKSGPRQIPQYRNLIIKNNATNPSYQVDIDADSLDVVNAGNDSIRLILVNLTLDLTQAGVNGLDTGSMAVDTTYWLWVIYNPTTNTTAGLISASFTLAGLTLPSNYTYGRLVDFCRTATGATEHLDEINFATHANWDDVDDFDSTGGAAVYTHSAGSGTLTQVNADMANAGSDNTLYIFAYTVSSPSGDAALQITNAFALAAESLSAGAGAQTNMFLSAVSASTADFVISGTSTSGAITIDDVSLKTASIISFRSHNGIHLYDAPIDDTQLLSAGAADSWTDVDTSNFAGDTSLVKQGIVGWGLLEVTDATTSTAALRPNGATGNGKRLGTVRRNVAGNIYGSYNNGETIIALDSSLIFEYILSSVTPDLDLWLNGVYLNL